jgi:hypothetical protein
VEESKKAIDLNTTIKIKIKRRRKRVHGLACLEI